jgi:hypothetical protein
MISEPLRPTRSDYSFTAIGSREPVTVHDYRPEPRPVGEPFTVEVEFDGRLSVCDEHVNVLASFDPQYHEFAEEMRNRLTIRKLAGERR